MKKLIVLSAVLMTALSLTSCDWGKKTPDAPAEPTEKPIDTVAKPEDTLAKPADTVKVAPVTPAEKK